MATLTRIGFPAILIAAVALTGTFPHAARATPVTIDNGFQALSIDMEDGAGTTTFRYKPAGYFTQLISEMSWFYRRDGVDDREHRFGTPDSTTINSSGSSVEFQWQMADFVATLVIGANAKQSMTIQNTSGELLDISVFGFLNYNGSGPGQPEQHFWGYSKVNDAHPFGQIVAQTYDATVEGTIFRVPETNLGAIDDALLLLAQMADDNANDFGPFSGQYTSGDTALLFEWKRSLEIESSFTGSITLLMAPLPSAVTLGLAGVGVVAARRRRGV